MSVSEQSQQRYLLHQGKNKANELVAIMKKRHSDRIYLNEPLETEVIDELVESTKYAPSSCDRRAVRLKLVTDRNEKALIGGLLVGGVGWIHRAPAILLLWAELDSYKAGEPSGREKEWMPQLDAGIIVNQLYLKATAMGLSCAFANPQIRDNNIDYFYKNFQPKNWTDPRFLGAFAFGKPSGDTVEKNYDYNYSMLVD